MTGHEHTATKTVNKKYSKSNPHPMYLKAAAGEWLQHSDIAKLVRSALAVAFPGVKFGVTTKTYSGGGSVDVRWQDGPTSKQVEAITGQFRTRGFDGMIDMSHDSDLWMYPDGSAHTAHDRGTVGSRGTAPEVIESPRSGDAVLLSKIAGAYIFCHRNIGAKAIRVAIAELRAERWASLSDVDWSSIGVRESAYGASVTGADSIQCGGRAIWLSSEIHSRAHSIEYPDGNIHTST